MNTTRCALASLLAALTPAFALAQAPFEKMPNSTPATVANYTLPPTLPTPVEDTGKPVSGTATGLSLTAGQSGASGSYDRSQYLTPLPSTNTPGQSGANSSYDRSHYLAPSPSTTTPSRLRMPGSSLIRITRASLTAPAQADGKTPEPIEVNAPLLPLKDQPDVSPEAEGAPPPADDRWYVMKHLQGGWLGTLMYDNRISFLGWTDQSYTGSTTAQSNIPVTWNDRANRYLLQQHWMRLERSIVTDSTTPTWGFRIDVLAGSDYRWSMMRGILDGQMINHQSVASPTSQQQNFQNLYGLDPIQHYLNLYCPSIKTEFRVGRLYTPWGVESLEAVSCPLPSRSYAFNWSPPFTHYGIGAYTTINDQWSMINMLVNGNDIMIGDPSEEMRYVGLLRWAKGADSVAVATSMGRGKFNRGDPFHPNANNPTTVGLSFEPLGRNNFNAFDLVWTHAFNSALSYNVELIYAYQYDAPIFATGSFSTPGALSFGFANWYSAAHYLFYNFSDKVTGIVRGETFVDAQGQRTGFPGLYTAVTGGAQIRLTNSIIFRPEIRYDYCGQSRPFQGDSHDCVTAVADLIVRW